MGAMFFSHKNRFPNQNTKYLNLTVEFGTFPNLFVLNALRRENAAYFHSNDPNVRDKEKAELLHAFCPDDPEWRDYVLKTGEELFEQGVSFLSKV